MGHVGSQPLTFGVGGARVFLDPVYAPLQNIEGFSPVWRDLLHP